MSEKLTREDLAILQAPFPVEAHKFYRGLVYLHEEPITERIEEVDPAFGFRITQSYYRGHRPIAVGELTIKGCTRGNTGMDEVKFRKAEAKPTAPANESNDGEKNAATDAFKRCARLFGVGRYLLTLPKDSEGNCTVTDERTLAAWLVKQQTPVIEWPSEAAVNQLLAICQERGICETYEDMKLLAGIEQHNWGKYPTGKAAFKAIEFAVNQVEYEDIPL